ncbi:MAG: universal stress protein [Betaproteobacteria bacterium]|nr:universal stress protein [Betaproteobacteria bacterium]NBO45304.1 universal stress protein [Betaproteobacteria bacterium]NBP11594.1 universal stress protein [Betaproteobacteria bacterium]NBP62340.1 universal stress protein [Betaproteobacteria bacterium]NBQ10258.1 universal stress protein [Betaproteobacteria bacterium]
MQTVLIPTGLGLDPQALQDHLKRLHHYGGVRVLLLSVQPRYNGHVRRYLGEALVKAVIRKDAEREFSPWRRLLEAAAIPYSQHIELGVKTETIVRFAQQIQCRRIVLGHAPPQGLMPISKGGLKARLREIARALGFKLDLCDKPHPPQVQRTGPINRNCERRQKAVRFLKRASLDPVAVKALRYTTR